LRINDGCRADERLDDLKNNGLMILQKKNGVGFGMDAVLLAHFARLRPHDRVADLGTGTGVLSILMSRAEPTARFFAFEIQPELADMARRSVALNGLEDRIKVYDRDLREAAAMLGRESCTAVVCNPPYGRRGDTVASGTRSRLLARH
jgi:tRNA1Val (adenine37-N6)-methyltransferase